MCSEGDVCDSDTSDGKFEPDGVWKDGECVVSEEPEEPSEPNCGDGICGADENYLTCPQDCEAPQQPGGICKDSDGGVNYKIKGSARNMPFTIGYRDCCKDNDEGRCIYDRITRYLHEGYCDGNIPKRILYECPNGCLNGVCV